MLNRIDLAISDDAKYLYVGLDGKGTVQRLLLPGLTPDISIPLGSDPNLGAYHALDLQVAPGAPKTIAYRKARRAPSSRRREELRSTMMLFNVQMSSLRPPSRRMS